MKTHRLPLGLLSCAFLLPAQAAPVVVNEFNAVSSSQTLAGGFDAQFGGVAGNGGDWFELVVVGTGVGSTVDLRGWRIESQRLVVPPFTPEDVVVLSNDPYWASVPAGTILTFTQARTAEGGMNTALNATNLLATEGWAHSNIWIGDPLLVTYTDSGTNGYSLDPVAGVGGYNLSDDDTQMRLRNGVGTVVFGPVGEGVRPAGNEIGNQDMFTLQQAPSSLVTPLSHYGDSNDDSDSSAYSTFGRPNRWKTAGEMFTQSFTGFLAGPAAPVLLSSQANLDLLSGDPFSYSIQSLDANSNPVTLSMLQGPGFLSLSDNGNGSGLLSGTPTLAQAGRHVVRLQVSDNLHGVHQQAFVLTVLPRTAPVIVNEYNAVSSSAPLAQDWSFDHRFGRVMGNGDDWIELVVVGTGAPASTVDMRGWQIKVLEDGLPAATITLSSAAFWQNVQAGTILTFTESATAAGGWDTSLLAENRRTIEGWSWSNIHLGDGTLINLAQSTPKIGIGGNQTRITILNNAGLTVAGPYGEGVYSANAVSNTQVFRLAANPAPGTHPRTTQFGSADTSTFGHPNRLPDNDGTVPGLLAGTSTGSQSFQAFATGVSSRPPYFTNLWGTPDTNNTLPGNTWNGPLVTALDPDHAASTLVFSLLAPPAGFGLVNNGNGSASLSWTPSAAQIGVHKITVKVSDPAGAFLTRTFKIAVMPSSSPVLVNEYNAVSSNRFLNRGTASADTDGGMAMDSFFGRILGNGGDWLELVVVGNGSAGSVVDMRGWKIDISENFSPVKTVVLGQHPYLAAVQAGTILTFIEHDTIAGGVDSAIQRVNRFQDLGFAWTNIAVKDANFVDQIASTFAGSITITSDETEITLRNAAGAVVNGPVGETRILRNVNIDEIFHLELNPSPSVNASVAAAGFPIYADNAESSSFGAPNRWLSGTTQMEQSFSPFTSAIDTNSVPAFTQLPTFFYGLTGLLTSQPVQAVDFNGNASVSLSLVNSPAWVSLVDHGNGQGTLTWTPTGGAGGYYNVSLVASDGLDSVVRTFPIFVHNTPAPVILNEYNAISSSTFLNGGTATMDSNGGAASDLHFGRVAKNGGDWFELAVVGNDGLGVLDMRGWTIEVSAAAGFPFQPRSVVKLSNSPFWAAVRHGTILTFIEDRTSSGGLNTTINAIDEAATGGWTWHNLWIGDPAYFTYTSPAVNGYLIDPATGAVSNFDITSVDTQFMVKNAGGGTVYGPVGEGIALTNAITTQNVWELVGHPRSTITPHAVADLGIPRFGAAASTDGSTFGQPNRWNSGANAQDFTVFVPPYYAYVAAAGLSGSDALTTADPDFDKLTNLIEYALLLNPSVPDGADTLPAPVIVDGKLGITFTRRKNAGDLLYSVEISETLLSWTAVSTLLEYLDNGDGTETVTIGDSALVAGLPRKFIRIRVTQLF